MAGERAAGAVRDGLRARARQESDATKHRAQALPDVLDGPSGLVTALCTSWTGADAACTSESWNARLLLDFLQRFDRLQFVHAHAQHVHAHDRELAELRLDHETPEESFERNRLGDRMQRSFQQRGRREQGSREHGRGLEVRLALPGGRLHCGDGACGKQESDGNGATVLHRFGIHSRFHERSWRGRRVSDRHATDADSPVGRRLPRPVGAQNFQLRLAAKKKKSTLLNEPATSPRPPSATGALPVMFVCRFRRTGIRGSIPS